MAMAIPTTTARPMITPAVIPPTLPFVISTGPAPAARRQREKFIVRLS